MNDYLLEMGGKPMEVVLEGDGWTVKLSKIEDRQVGSLSVGQIRVVMSGDEDSFDRLKTMMEPKLLRAGG
jgi:hypothetical protein